MIYEQSSIVWETSYQTSQSFAWTNLLIIYVYTYKYTY